MKKTLPGILLLAVAAFAGWTWWKRRQTPDPAGDVTVAPNADTSLLPNLSQVGSNVYQDVTADLVDKLIANYERITNGCWSYLYTDTDGSNRGQVWINSMRPTVQVKFPLGSPSPLPICGGAGAAGPNSAASSSVAQTSLSRGSRSSGNFTVTDADGCRRTYDSTGREIAATC